MRKYAFHTEEIPNTRPSKEEQRRKLAIYDLKRELGLLIPFDGVDLLTDKDIRIAGFKDLADYEIIKLETLQMLSNNIKIPNDIQDKLRIAKSIIDSK